MPAEIRTALFTCLQDLGRALRPFKGPDLGGDKKGWLEGMREERFEWENRIALPWIRGEMARLHVVCSQLAAKGRFRHLLVALSEIAMAVNRLGDPPEPDPVWKKDAVVSMAEKARDAGEKEARGAYLGILVKMVIELVDEVGGVGERIHRTGILTENKFQLVKAVDEQEGERGEEGCRGEGRAEGWGSDVFEIESRCG